MSDDVEKMCHMLMVLIIVLERTSEIEEKNGSKYHGLDGPLFTCYTVKNVLSYG